MSKSNRTAIREFLDKLEKLWYSLCILYLKWNVGGWFGMNDCANDCVWVKFVWIARPFTFKATGHAFLETTLKNACLVSSKQVRKRTIHALVRQTVNSNRCLTSLSMHSLPLSGPNRRNARKYVRFIRWKQSYNYSSYAELKEDPIRPVDKTINIAGYTIWLMAAHRLSTAHPLPPPTQNTEG